MQISIHMADFSLFISIPSFHINSFRTKGAPPHTNSPIARNIDKYFLWNPNASYKFHAAQCVDTPQITEQHTNRRDYVPWVYFFPQYIFLLLSIYYGILLCPKFSARHSFELFSIHLLENGGGGKGALWYVTRNRSPNFFFLLSVFERKFCEKSARTIFCPIGSCKHFHFPRFDKRNSQKIGIEYKLNVFFSHFI